MSTHSQACCEIPPVIAEDYSPKGEYVTLNGMRTYVTGPKDADTAIFFVYDIFGYYPQTVQGADILAYSNKEKQYQVFVPDFFEGKPASNEWFTSGKEEDKAKISKFFEGAAPPIHLPKIPQITQEAEKHNSKIKTWGIIGYCWGGKMTSLVAAQQSVFKAGVQTSPAMVDPSDAEKITIPMCVLASKEEKADDIKKYAEGLKVPNHVETFGDMPHGWMSGRGDLKDAKGKSEYERGYKIAVQFFHDHL